MQCALFGKVPSKRDFVAPNASRQFLDVWEPWINAAMSASRQSLGNEWQAAFLKAPIWRFWLGADLCGATVAGALMPSLDGVGRYFPLTAFVIAPEGSFIPPPEMNPQDEWFAEIENFLLSTLDHDVTFEAITASLEQMGRPATFSHVGGEGAPLVVADAVVSRVPAGQPSADTFATMRLADPAKVYSSATSWWTIGGEGYEPLAILGHKMPNPFMFTEMLTGRFVFGLG
jgi:type VI secretion system protein ImpM